MKPPVYSSTNNILDSFPFLSLVSLSLSSLSVACRNEEEKEQIDCPTYPVITNHVMSLQWIDQARIPLVPVKFDPITTSKGNPQFNDFVMDKENREEENNSFFFFLYRISSGCIVYPRFHRFELDSPRTSY
jgi:hypothetical protein